MAPKPTKTADERATDVIEAIRRQLRGAANAARRAAGPLTEAGVNEDTRAALIAKLEPFWADVQAGIKGVHIANGASETPLLAQVQGESKTKNKK